MEILHGYGILHTVMTLHTVSTAVSTLQCYLPWLPYGNVQLNGPAYLPHRMRRR